MTRTKFTWGHGIAMAIVLFIIFILSFVFRTLFDPQLKHDMESKEYYKEDLAFPLEQKRRENSAALAQDVSLMVAPEGLWIHFPKNMDHKKIKAKLIMHCLADKQFDIERDMKLDSISYLIPGKELRKSRYTFKLDWDYDTIPYQYRSKFNL